MASLMLCFNGDGPFRDNLVRTVAYPTGFSYFRPFRYRDQWVSAPILAKVSSDTYRQELEQRVAILAARFVTPGHEWKLMPIRAVRISFIHHVPDNHLVYFVLDRFIDFRGTEKLDEVVVEVPPEERATVGNQLFFETSLQFPYEALADPASEEELWVRYTQGLVSSDLPLKEDTRLAVFLRVGTPLHDGTATGLGELYRATQTGPLHGAILSEGDAYEFAYLHRIPGLVGTDVASDRFRIQHLSVTGNLELERPDDESSAHYQPHNFQLTARAPSGRGEELILRPDRPSVNTDDGRELLTFDVPVPLRVRKNFWYRARTSWIWGFLLVLAFILVSMWEARQRVPAGEDVSWLSLFFGALPAGGLGAMLWLLQQRVSR